ncbi:hypothetical protein VPHD51_0169 [Vibrio phage D51]
MLESNGNVTFFAGLVKEGFKSELHTPGLKYQVCGTTNYEYMVHSVMQASWFFGIPRYEAIYEIISLYEIPFVDNKKLEEAIVWWGDFEGWKPEYKEWV